MNQTEVEDTLSQARKLVPHLGELKEQFYNTYEPDENDNFLYHEEFAEEFNPLADKHNALSLKLMRELIERRFGQSYRGIYPGAGEDIEFCSALGGEWFFIDKAYDNEIVKFSKESPEGKVLFEAEAITHDYTSPNLPRQISSGSLGVALLRQPYGANPELNKKTGYRPSENDSDMEETARWEGLLRHSVIPLKTGGVLISEADFDEVMDVEEWKETTEPYARRLEKMKNMLDINDLNSILIARYMKRTYCEGYSRGYSEPYFFDYLFYNKK